MAAGADRSGDEIRDHRAPWGTHRQAGFLNPFGHLWLVGALTLVSPVVNVLACIFPPGMTSRIGLGTLVIT